MPSRGEQRWWFPEWERRVAHTEGQDTDDGGEEGGTEESEEDTAGSAGDSQDLGTSERRLAILWCGVLCAVGLDVVILQVSSGATPNGPANGTWAQLSLPLLVLLLAVALLALSLRIWRSVWDIIALIGLLSIGAMPSVLAVASPESSLHLSLFLVALVFWILVALAPVARNAEDVWAGVLKGLLALTTVVTVFSEIGLHVPGHFAAGPVEQFLGLRSVIDSRVALGILFVGLCLGTATVRAFSVVLPDPPRLPIPRVPGLRGNHPNLAALTNPLIVLLNAAILSAVTVANVLLGVAVTLFLRLVKIGVDFADLIWHLVFEDDTAIDLLRAVAMMIVTIVVTVATFELSPHVCAYLRAASAAAYQELPWVGLLALTVLLGTTVLALVIDRRSFITARVLFGASLIAVLLLLTGGAAYVLALTNLLGMVGFERIGPVSIVGSVLMIVGAGAVAVVNAIERRRARTAG